jgi:hypothetical protein
MTDDDGPDYWQSMQEQEREQQEAAGALESYQQTGAKHAVQASERTVETGPGAREEPCAF